MLAVQNLQNFKDPVNTLTLQNLKAYLKSIPHDKSVELLCLDDCTRCDVIVDGEKDPDIDSIDDFIDTSVKVYTYDYYRGFQEQRKTIFFDKDNIEKNVCFSFSVDKKGVSDQVAVMFDDKVYDYTTYLTPTPVYSSLQALVDTKDINTKAGIQ